MILSRLKLAVVAGTAILLFVVGGGAALMLARGKAAAWTNGESMLERSAQVMESALSRQLLQVDGALASLSTLLGAAGASAAEPERIAAILRGLNFQTLAFRDLMLVDREGRVLASARSRGPGRRMPLPAPSDTRTTVIGPLRNNVTGDWSLYLARNLAGFDGVRAVAEVPLPVLTKLVGEVATVPGVQLRLQRADGRLIASLPHDELSIGEVVPPPSAEALASGLARLDRAAPGGPLLTVSRQTLYGDINLTVSARTELLFAQWHKERDATLGSAALASFLLLAFAAALLAALHQRDTAEIDRQKAANVLADAIEAMADGFVMWDRDDRLVTCNQRYRDLYHVSAPFLAPGERFEDIIRSGALAGQYPQAGDIETFVRATTEWHRSGVDTLERLLPDGRWLLITERPMRDGNIVGIRTDITALKKAQADLTAANERAREAVIEAQRQNAALVEQERRIRFLALHDDLTGLHNRLSFRARLSEALETASADHATIALLFLDLDRFKDVNDTLGHPVGDRLLCVVAERLAASVGEAACLARLGGDEFAIISVDPHQPAMAEALSARIIAALGAPFLIDGHTIALTTSIGIAVAESGAASADLLLKRADLALYRAKAAGRNEFRLFAEDMDEALRERLLLEADLTQALAADQFDLAYQPIFDLGTDSLSGFECLLRWNHPGRGSVSPAEFIPVAEETRLIVEIGAWVLRRACRDAVLLPGRPMIAVNVSPVQLALGGLPELVEEVLRETGLAPERLELEITETSLFANDSRNLAALQRLRTMGVRIVLDDFGTGYSSLSHLRLCPLDKIKIDRSFVREMTANPDSAVIVAAIAALASQLGMKTTAEGVETADQLRAVRQAGCSQAQGYLLGQPRPVLNAVQVAAERHQPVLGRPLSRSA